LRVFAELLGTALDLPSKQQLTPEYLAWYLVEIRKWADSTFAARAVVETWIVDWWVCQLAVIEDAVLELAVNDEAAFQDSFGDFAVVDGEAWKWCAVESMLLVGDGALGCDGCMGWEVVDNGIGGFQMIDK
jgi:hypothetical protein